MIDWNGALAFASVVVLFAGAVVIIAWLLGSD